MKVDEMLYLGCNVRVTTKCKAKHNNQPIKVCLHARHESGYGDNPDFM